MHTHPGGHWESQKGDAREDLFLEFGLAVGNLGKR